MRICIVIQSDAFRQSAGMRIRYDRFRDCLPGNNVSIDAVTCAELTGPAPLDHDVYIFCKTFDMAALVLARRIQAAGKVVGQDLFDDYFSQYSDQRLERFRDWLRDMAPVTDFALCSTRRMGDVLQAYLPGIRIVPVDDPVIGYDPLMVSALADAKLSRARQSRILDVAWFGIGDNPYFSVGLADLVACEPDLARIERLGWKVRLRIVTNRRPYEGAGAEVLRALSVDHETIEWTEQTERDTLVQSTVAILPVNGQSFSRAKSMNRAVTALNAGCQVLSIGYPLYERLDPFLYRDVDTLMSDVDAERCRVRSETVTALTHELSAMANPFESASVFVQEAALAMSSPRVARGLLCVVHGRASTIVSHKGVNSLGGVSIATMFTGANWNFNMRFDVVEGATKVRVAKSLVDRFTLPVQPGETVRIGTLDFHELDLAALAVPPLTVLIPGGLYPVQDLSLYEAVLGHVEQCCRAAFGAIDLLVSDGSPAKRRLHPVRDAA